MHCANNEVCDEDRIRWVPSRFNMRTTQADGSLLLFNSFSGAFYRFESALALAIGAFLDGRDVEIGPDASALLAVNGFLVKSTADEIAQAAELHEEPYLNNDRLHLTVMPTENCNFRCVYCYEDFKRNRMPAEVLDSLIRFVEREADRLRTLSVSWFGGEPLAAIHIVDHLSKSFLKICEKSGINYSASMTTNGYLLTRTNCDICLAARISRFQITLDGPADVHNQLRPLAGGGRSFERILHNLRELRDRHTGFHVRIRVNFTPESTELIPAFIRSLGADFGHDERFSVCFRPVGHWGGHRDREIAVCDQHQGEAHEISFMGMALEAGFSLAAWREVLQPFGSTCYAASPQSFVVGSNGAIYKCTVALNDVRNHVGHLSSDGCLELNHGLHERWIRSGEEKDIACQECRFRPACQGNLCPLERLNEEEKRCPTAQRENGSYLQLLAVEAQKAH
jgi:uncharacterized protein